MARTRIRSKTAIQPRISTHPRRQTPRYTYSQSTGQLKLGDQILGVGYSGIGAARNNSARQAQQDGPIPIGEYRILQRGKDARIKREAIGLLPFPKTHLGRFPGEAFAIIFEPVPPETVPSGAIIVLPRNVWDAITTNTHLDVVP